MKIVYSPAAIEDLKNIKKYISVNLQNNSAAKHITSEILKSCHRLTDFPNIGVSLKAKLNIETDYRCLFCKNYIIFYKRETDIKIIRILDGRTEYLRELFFYSIE